MTPYGSVPSQYGTQADLQRGTPVSASEAVGYGWRAFTRNAGPLLLLAVVVLAVSAVLNVGGRVIDNSAVVAVWSVVANIVSLILAAGVIRAALAVLDGRKPDVGMLFSGPGTVTYILASVVVGIALSLAAFLGLFLFLIGALILPFVVGFLLQFYGAVAIDQPDAGVFGSLSRSSQLVRRNIGQVLLFDLFAIGILIVGALLLGVGLLVAYPVVVIGGTYLYRRLNNGQVVEPA